MTEIVDVAAALIARPGVLLALFAAMVGGLVRGFAGFGGALIFIPVAAAAVGPAIAAPALLLFDGLGTLPLLRRALPNAERRVVLPLALGAVLTVPLGVLALTRLDPVPVRWGIFVLILTAVAAIAAGWRWPGPPKLRLSFGVGLFAGFTGGLAQLSGPPIVLYLLGGARAAITTRANLFAFFGLNTITSGLSYAVAGLFSREVFVLALMVAPIYVVGLAVGGRLFPLAPEAVYRRLALALILAAAIIGSPLVS